MYEQKYAPAQTPKLLDHVTCHKFQWKQDCLDRGIPLTMNLHLIWQNYILLETLNDQNYRWTSQKTVKYKACYLKTMNRYISDIAIHTGWARKKDTETS